jgi:hypothetical protein
VPSSGFSRLRATLPVLVFVVAAVPAGCNLPNPAPVSQQPESAVSPTASLSPTTAVSPTSHGAGWERLDIDGSVDGGGSLRAITDGYCWTDTFAAGVRDGQPLLVKVVSGSAREVRGGSAREVIGAFPSAGHNGLGSVVFNADDIFATEELDPADAKRATMWHGAYNLGYFSPELTQWEQIWDARGVIPGWLSPLMDGEENLRAVGAVRAKDRWELHAWQANNQWFSLDRGHQLYVHVKPSSRSVLTASTETTVIVAGAISERPDGSGASPQVWWIEDEQGFDDGRWKRAPTASTPDALTDIAQWDLGWWVAGHRKLRPVIYDFDRMFGASMPVPDTRLDPARPGVYVAGIPVGQDPMVLATQSVDGPTVWVQKGKSWLRIPAPAGTLSAAQTVADGVYLLIDGALWFRSMPEVGC